MKVLKLLDGGMDRVMLACDWISRVALVALTVLVNAEVIARAFFDVSTLVSDEYGGYLFVALTFLGFVPTFRRGQFLRMGLIVDRLRAPHARSLLVVSLAIGIAMLAVFTYAAALSTLTSYTYNVRSEHFSSTLVYIPQLFMFAGVALLLVAFVLELVLLAGGLRKSGGPRSDKLGPGMHA